METDSEPRQRTRKSMLDSDEDDDFENQQPAPSGMNKAEQVAVLVLLQNMRNGAAAAGPSTGKTKTLIDLYASNTDGKKGRGLGALGLSKSAAGQ